MVCRCGAIAQWEGQPETAKPMMMATSMATAAT